MINYEEFKLDSNNMRKLAPILLEELADLKDDDTITVVMKDLSGKESKNQVSVKQTRAGLNNPQMTDMVISSTEMRFER